MVVHNSGSHRPISFFVNCETQDEVDELWHKLSDGGEKERCGWLKDKYGLSWQIVPSILGKLLRDKGCSKGKPRHAGHASNRQARHQRTAGPVRRWINGSYQFHRLEVSPSIRSPHVCTTKRTSASRCSLWVPKTMTVAGFQSGATRITSARNCQRRYPKMSHDGSDGQW